MLVAAAITVTLACAGCTGAGEEPGAPIGAPAQASGVATLGPEDVELEHSDALVDPGETEALPDPTALGCAAQAVMVAWARPDLPHEQWWEALSPLLTAGARDIVVDTDPASIPVHEAFAGELVDGGSDWLVWVSFSTDVGGWWVLLAWQADGSWLADRITQTGPDSGEVIGSGACAR